MAFEKSSTTMMSKKETAEFCKVSLATINRWMKDGRLRYLKLGRRVLFNQEHVLADLERHEVEATAA